MTTTMGDGVVKRPTVTKSTTPIHTINKINQEINVLYLDNLNLAINNKFNANSNCNSFWLNNLKKYWV